MSFRFHRGLAAISILWGPRCSIQLSISLTFVQNSHNPASPPSRAALQLLQSALTGGFPTPSSPPLSFELEVVENAPTATQLTSIAEYLGKPLSALMSAHPSGNATTQGMSPIELSRELQNNINAIKYPLVVNWNDGESSVGDVESVRKLIANLAAKQQ